MRASASPTSLGKCRLSRPTISRGISNTSSSAFQHSSGSLFAATQLLAVTNFGVITNYHHYFSTFSTEHEISKLFLLSRTIFIIFSTSSNLDTISMKFGKFFITNFPKPPRKKQAGYSAFFLFLFHHHSHCSYLFLNFTSDLPSYLAVRHSNDSFRPLVRAFPFWGCTFFFSYVIV